jgi:hypothetical protein
MSTIGGPGGIGGPKAPTETDLASDLDSVAGEARVTSSRAAAPTTELQALVADVDAGRLTRHEALDRLVEATAGPGLDATQRAELRELLTDLLANDPYLGGLIGRI